MAQVIGGVGTSLSMVTAKSIIISNYPDKKDFFIGLLEAGAGLGILAGPLLGSFLYDYGGYLTPFYSVSGVLLVLLIIRSFVMEYLPEEIERKRLLA